MPKRNAPSASSSPATSIVDLMQADPENEEYDEQRFKNRERAFVAASRRTDRTIESRIISATMASRYHQRIYGRALRINEEVVRGDGIYEEVEDPEDTRRRLQLGDLTEEDQVSLANALPGTEQYEIAQRLKREADVTREFDQLYPGLVEQMRMRTQQQQHQQQQQQLSMMAHGQSMQQLQWQQQQQQQQQQQELQVQQYMSGQQQMFSPQQQHQQAPILQNTAVYQQQASNGYSNGMNSSGHQESQQMMMAGLENLPNNENQYIPRSKSLPNGADMLHGYSSGSNSSGAPMASRGFPRHSFGSAQSNGTFVGVPPLSNNAPTPGSTPSVSTPTSQEGAYVASPHGNFQMQTAPMNQHVPAPVLRHNSNGSGIFFMEPMTTMDMGKAAEQNAWSNQGVTMAYAWPLSNTQPVQAPPTQHESLFWAAQYLPTTTEMGSENGLGGHSTSAMVNAGPYPSTNGAASVPMDQQLSSRIGTPGGSAGDQWTDWVQFNNEGN